MKSKKCPICGSENREGTKYCRICFSRLYSLKNVVLNTSIYPKINKRKNLLNILFVIVLLLILFLLIR
ncbi:MAG: hypothetical protein SNJ64_05910 [Endomicrobiia bacterium]